MGQAVKYVALGTGIAVILVSIVAIIGSFYPVGFIGQFSTAIGGSLSYLSPYFQNVRGCINYIIGDSASASLFSAILHFDLLFGIALIPVEVTITVIRFINQ